MTFITLILSSALALQTPTDIVFFEKPAACFEEAIPLGNGHLGAMVYGGISDDLINLNDATLWGGHGTDLNPVPDGPEKLSELRESLWKEDWSEAFRRARHFQCTNAQAFFPMGDVHIRQEVRDPRNYTRILDLSKACAFMSFTDGDVSYSREYLVSHPGKVLAIRLEASSPGALSFSLDGETIWWNESHGSTAINEYAVGGQMGWYMGTQPQYPHVFEGPDGEKGMRYQFRIRVTECDGKIESGEDGIRVMGATSATVLVCSATSFAGYDRLPDSEGLDEKALCLERMESAAFLSYEGIKKNHEEDYKAIYGRMSISLPGHEDEERYLNYGRYLMAACSREDSPTPSNLQGIWCKDRYPAWGCDYTTNINLEMNYWPAEPLAMGDLAEPLFKFLENVSVTGKRIARNMYGMDGWVLHHNSDIWCNAAPVGEHKGNPRWANWPMGAAWLCQNLYEHYLFSFDVDFLRERAYPLMKGAAEFLLDYMVERDGQMVIAPSTSPENNFVDEQGRTQCVAINSASDLELTQSLLENVIRAGRILHTDLAFRIKCRKALSKLSPLQIGHKGNLMEWYKDWEDKDPQHRHISHAIGFYPCNVISQERTPLYAEALLKSLEIRGEGGPGWSKAWKISIYARYHDARQAYRELRMMLDENTAPNLMDIYRYNAESPFQIDANFGTVAGMAEMLIQSHQGKIELLPAVPEEWKEGSVKGIRARGGYTVDFDWEDGKLTRAVVHASKSGKVRIVCADKRWKKRIGKGKSFEINI